MYTQCPKCETVFKMSAEVLRAAGGQVKCGQCGEIFSALARLAEDESAFSTSESSLEMETRADRILESAARMPPAPQPQPQPQPPEEDPAALEAADVEFARLQVIDMPPETLEFSLPPTELDRVFVEAKPASPRAPSKREPPAPADTAGTSRPPAHGRAPPPRPTAPAPRAAPASPATAAAPASAPSETQIDLLGEDGLPPHPESSRAARELAQRRAAGGEVFEDVRRAMLADMAERTLEPLDAPRPRPLAFFLWLAAALLLTALLATQWVLGNRAWLTRTFGLGAANLPNLFAYQQQVWGVTGDPGANGTLRVRASILNASAQLQPYPLLRITLTDRFGNRLGMRDFEPAEYLGKPTVRMLAPGERVDATLDIQDPGKEAEGYELDVCLRAEQRVVCASDVAPRSAR